MVLKKSQGFTKVIWIHPVGTINICTKSSFMAIRLKIVELFQSGPTDKYIHSSLAKKMHCQYENRN